MIAFRLTWLTLLVALVFGCFVAPAWADPGAADRSLDPARVLTLAANLAPADDDDDDDDDKDDDQDDDDKDGDKDDDDDDDEDEGWISIFDGKTLDGWEASEKPENWKVEDGAIVGRGPRSHLFYKAREFDNLEFQAEVMLNKGGNSGMYFRTAFGPGWPKGYEAQVNNSGGDPVRTGSLYYMAKVLEQLVPDDTWWTQSVRAEGNHIVIKVNGKVTVDYVDEKNTYAKGYVALQQHDPGSVVHYRNLKVRPLAAAN